MSQLEIALTLHRIRELEEEIRKLRERVAVLESRQIQHPLPPPLAPYPWPPQPTDPYAPPFTVTCGTAQGASNE